jgi:2-keto-4-pentenoate hydratase
MNKPTTDRFNAAAEALFAARASRTAIAPLRETYGVVDAGDAYAVQELNTVRYLAAGRRLVGRKIGLTSKAVQQQLGVDEPDYGMVWADDGYFAGDSIPLGHFLQPKVEAEIAFIMGSDLDEPQPLIHDVIRAVDCVVAAIEIVDSAIENWNIKLVDTIADNASGGGYVLGDRVRLLGAVDLRDCAMTLSRNGVIASQGVGSACLGHPLRALLWLARKMTAVGRPLRAGDLVLSGALGPMVAVAAGDRFDLDIQGIGSFRIDFAVGAEA